MQHSRRPLPALASATATDRLLRGLATYLLHDAALGARPLPICGLEQALARQGLRVERVPAERFSGGVTAHLIPMLNAVLIPDDLSEAEQRWQLAHCLFHLMLDNAEATGFACRPEGQTMAECRRADHGAKFLTAGDAWYGGLVRVEEAAAHFGVPAYQLVEAIRDQI